jgi:diguanylate cyclase (GGDEF)-like protein
MGASLTGGLLLIESPATVHGLAIFGVSGGCAMTILSAAPPIAPAASSETGSGDHSAERTERAAGLVLSAFMSMSRAVAIIGSDGQLLLANVLFDQLFGDTDLLDRINPDASRNDGKSDCQINLADGRAFWVETIPMDDGWLVSAYNMTERLAKARTDTLTKLGNRLMFHEQLTQLLASPDSATEAAAVLTIDLGRFKAINETLGRNIGDGLLRLVADRIRSALGHGDLVARLEGDKFGVIQNGQPQPQSAALLARRLIDSIGHSYVLDGQLISTAANVGIVLLPAGACDGEQILKNADLALHRAKSDGNGTYRFFEAAMDETMQSRRNLEIDLRRALRLGEFSLVYQPQFDLQSNKVTGFEALLRWQSPTRGAVPPLDFIPVAEETGIINSIGEWVLRTACSEAARWPGTRAVAVNVSAVQFASPNLVPMIVSALAESGLTPRRLELEITESVLLDVRGTALAMLQRLREIGVRISLDDFGTGYSSLGYLRSFPFDKIKIDQSFVRSNSDDAVGRAIVRTVAALGQSLGMATVAEGVETDEQMARVGAEGCTAVQGYLISRPMPPEQIGSFLRSRNETASRDSSGASPFLRDLI